MSLFLCEGRELVPVGGRSDCDIGKAQRMTTAMRKVRQYSTDYLHSRAAEMKDANRAVATRQTARASDSFALSGVLPP